MIDIDKLNKEIDVLVDDWQPNGSQSVSENGRVVLRRTYGFHDKNNTVPISKDEKYFVNFNEKFFPALALLLLIDDGRIRLSDSLQKYIPEYEFSKDITIKHLLEDSAAMPCWYNGKIMMDFDKDEKHKALPVEERIRTEQLEFARDRSFAEKLALIKGLPLETTPGLMPFNFFSYTASAFLKEIVERVSGKSLFAFLDERVFKRFGVTFTEGNSTTSDSFYVYRETNSVFIPKTPSQNGFTTNMENAEKFFEAFMKNDLFSDKVKKLIFKKFDGGNGYLFSFVNGWAGIFVENADGSSLNVLLNFNRKTSIVTLFSRGLFFRRVDGMWTGFIRMVRAAVQGHIVYPLAPKMEKYDMKNCYDATSLTVKEEQTAFVSDAKSSLCWAYAEKDTKSYVLTDDGVAIGLLILQINEKKEHFYVGVVLIDKHYQGRGYGRFMVNFAVETLKKAGAKELTIGVNRNNVAARRLYESVGFKAADVYNEGVFMKLKF